MHGHDPVSAVWPYRAGTLLGQWRAIRLLRLPPDEQMIDDRHDDPDTTVDRLVAAATDPSNTRKLTPSLAQLLDFIRQRIPHLSREELVRLKLNVVAQIAEELVRRERKTPPVPARP